MIDLNVLLPRMLRRQADVSFSPDDDNVFGRTRNRTPAPILLGSMSDDGTDE